MKAILAIGLCAVTVNVAQAAGIEPPRTAGSLILQVQAKMTPAETKLRQALSTLNTANPNMSLFEPLLQVALQKQKAKTAQYFKSAGKIKSIRYLGPQNKGDVFQVNFENTISAWWIQLAANGNIAALTYQ